MITRYDFIYGIDPDVDGDGVGMVDVQQRSLFCAQWDLGTLVDTLQARKISLAPAQKMMVYVEGGWLNQGNWHLHGGFMSANKAAEIGRSAGRNHQRGMDIIELLRHHDIPCLAVKPLKKIWATRDNKISHEQLTELLRHSNITSNLKGRSNPEIRDASLIALEYSGIPLKVRPIGLKKNL